VEGDEKVHSRLASLQWWRFALGYALTIVAAAVLARIVWQHWPLGLRLARLSPYALSVVAVVVAINLCARAHFVRELVKELGVNVSRRECFLLLGTSHLLGMLTLPGAGAAYRAAYLYRRHGVDVLEFASGTGLFVIVGVFLWCLLGTAALVAVGMHGENLESSLLLVMLVIASALAGVRPVRRVLRHVSKTRTSPARRLVEGWCRVSSSRPICGVATKVVLCCAASQVAGFYLIFRCFALPVGPMGSLSIVAFHQLGGIVGLTPGAVGIQEGIGAVASAQLGLDVAQILVLLALMRAGRIGTSILVGVPCWWLLRRANPVSAR